MPDESRPAFLPTWPTCTVVASCIGAEAYGGACLVHLSGAIDPYLNRLGPGSDIDVRGTELDDSLMRRLLGAVTQDGRPVIGTGLFDHATFVGPVRFEGVEFRGPARFHDATFTGTAHFDDVRAGELEFVNARFEKRTWFGPLTAADLVLARVRCAAKVEVDVRAEQLNMRQARFEEGVVIEAGGGAIIAEQTRFGGPSLISGAGTLPRLRSLRATDVSNLELADVDLRWCAFAGAHRLDQLRIAGRTTFGEPPRGRWSRRRVIADERAWRGWPDALHQDIAPERVAGLYRSLRKAFEDSKNEAGAGDFYYGEMEMRRHSAETPRAERAILWVYWLLSGYGQRASRAVAALLVVIAVVGVLLAGWGQPAAEAARIAVGAVVLREPGAELTPAGQWTVMVARVLGPVLLALAVLAVRARVKR